MTPIERDRLMVLSPGEWPKWPVLPLMRRDGDFHADDAAGFLLAVVDQSRPVVYLGTIYRTDDIATEIKQETGKRANWSQIVARLPKREFDTLDAMLSAYRID
jgi:hypothetical protein